MCSRAATTPSRNKVVQSELAGAATSGASWPRSASLGLVSSRESGQIEIMVVMTEIGRRLAPNRVAAAALIPGGVIAELGSDAQRALLDEAGRRRETAGARPSRAGAARLGRAGDPGHPAGRLVDRHRPENPVLAGDSADVLVVTATLFGGGAGLFWWTPKRRAASPTDVRRPARRRDRVRRRRRRTARRGGDAVARIHATPIRYSSALLRRGCRRDGRGAGTHERPIPPARIFGGRAAPFQTLTQRAADMYVSLELARSMTPTPPCIADGRLDPGSAARPRSQIGLSGRHIAQEAIRCMTAVSASPPSIRWRYGAARLTGIEQTLGSSTDQLRFLSGQVGAGRHRGAVVSRPLPPSAVANCRPGLRLWASTAAWNIWNGPSGRQPVHLLVRAGRGVLDVDRQPVGILDQVGQHRRVDQVAVDRVLHQQALRQLVHGHRPEGVHRRQLTGRERQR